MLRDVAYGPYFLTYEAICRGWPGDMKRGLFHADLMEEIEAESRDVPWARLLVAGGFAGIVGWGSTYVYALLLLVSTFADRFIMQIRGGRSQDSNAGDRTLFTLVDNDLSLEPDAASFPLDLVNNDQLVPR